MTTATDPYQWVTIEDFTPGIISQSALSYSPNVGTGNTGPVPGSKNGQAQRAIGCIALPNGGLAPLPSLSATPIVPPATVPGSVLFVNGLFVNGPLNDHTDANSFDSVIYGIEGLNVSNLWDFDLFEAVVDDGVVLTQSTLETLTGLTTITNPSWVALTGDTTRANSTPTNVGMATVAIGYMRQKSGAGPFIWLYPDPTNPTSGTPYSTGETGYVICHQNRIIALTIIGAEQNWGGSTYLQQAYELYNYTDPPNGLAFGTQAEVFVQEHPFGHGTWGSISASQLFLVKHSGGGYVIQGDLNSPTVTRLPGVTSTYGLVSRSASETPLGLVYASNNRGLWSWAGGITSGKISNQLDDDAFANISAPGPITSGPVVDVRGWGDWIVVTNDWIFDTNTGGFWQLNASSSGQAHMYYGVSWDGNTLYASVPRPDLAGFAIDMYNRGIPSNFYAWKSYPIRLPSMTPNRGVMVREIVLRAQGEGTVTVILEGVNGTNTQTTASPGTNSILTFTTTAQPSMQRLTVGQVTAQDVTVTLNAVAATGTPAPVIYSVSVGYTEYAQPVTAT